MKKRTTTECPDFPIYRSVSQLQYGKLMRFYIFFAIPFALSACVTKNTSSSNSLHISHSGDVPSYIAQIPSCALVVGGAGSSFADQKVGKVWYEANRQIAGYLYENLVGEGYQVKRFVIPQDTSSQNVVDSVGLALAQAKCNTFIQVSHDVSEDNTGRYFQYSISVIHVELNKDNPRSPSGTNVTTVGDYSRDYRYPRTQYQLEAFRTGTFADKAFNELKASGVLARVSRGS